MKGIFVVEKNSNIWLKSATIFVTFKKNSSLVFQTEWKPFVLPSIGSNLPAYTVPASTLEKNPIQLPAAVQVVELYSVLFKNWRIQQGIVVETTYISYADTVSTVQ